jgi:hypothetical protein
LQARNHTIILLISNQGIEIKEQIFGVAWASANVPIGILGLGPDLDRGFVLNESHPFFLDAMAQSKSISSRVYSVGLGGADESEGECFFLSLPFFLSLQSVLTEE